MYTVKKVVLLGGGRGLSVLLRGLKLFPIDLTAIVAVSDDGSSTGRLREEFNMPAVGDLRGVLTAMAETEPLVNELLEYRFDTTSDLNGHPVGNLIITAMSKITGNLSSAIKELGHVFNIKGRILPFTEDYVTLVAHMTDGTVIEGESEITEAHKKIERISYKKEPKVDKEVFDAIKEADLIVFGIGSLYTSIIPNILSKKVRDAILESKAKKLYICNAMTQSGETDNYTVSDCVKTLNKYMKDDFLDAVIVSTTEIPQEVLDRYKGLESKSTILVDPLLLDEEMKNMDVEVISEDLIIINEEDLVQHDSIKTATVIFTYAMRK